MRAQEIISLLEAKHSDDVFIAECKDGPTHYSRHSRLDGWAMKKSWARPLYVGYEVKVARQDFLRDDKWPAYLNVCHQLYFVCAPGVMEPEECPEQCGLIVVSKTGTRLYTKRKAPHRSLEQDPVDLFRYALMRAVSFARHYDPMSGRDRNVERWRRWLRQKAESRELGWSVAKGIRDHCSALEETNRKLKRENEKLAEVRAVLDELGVDPATWDPAEKARDALRGKAPDRMRRALSDAIHSLKSLQNMWEREAPAQEDTQTNRLTD